MKTIKVMITVAEDDEVSGILAVPQNFQIGKTTAVIFAHGAGNDMNNPLIVYLANGLSDRGYLTLRFNFPYKEKGKKAPDSQKKLVQTWRSVYDFLESHPKFGPRSIVAAGKSMGGRVASQMIAENLLPVKQIVFLGYPLHAPGKKDKLRDAHLYHISIPMLFFAGTRDSLCDLSMLQNVLNKLKVSWDLDVIEGGDHSFNLPKSAKISQEDIYSQILDKTIAWLMNPISA